MHPHPLHFGEVVAQRAREEGMRKKGGEGKDRPSRLVPLPFDADPMGDRINEKKEKRGKKKKKKRMKR